MRTDGGRTRRLAGSETAACLGLAALVFAAVLAFGASDAAVAAVFSTIYAVFLAGLLAACGWARRDLARMRGLRLPLILAGVLLAVVLLPLTPWTPDGAHPVWDYVPGVLAAAAPDRSAVLLGVVNLLGLFCLYAAGRIVGASQTRGRRFLAFMLVAIGVYAAGALLHHVALRGAGRMEATLLGPNSAATVFAAALVMAAAGLMARLRRGGRRLLLRGDPQASALAALAAALFVCVLMTASRGGLIAAACGLGAFGLWTLFAGRVSIARALVAGAVILVLAVALTLNGADLVAERFGAAGQDLEIRARILEPHWRAFLAAPWFGYGLGAFTTINQMVVTRETLLTLHDVRAAHNLYVQWLEEAGIAGAAAMAALFVAAAAPVARAAFGRGGVAVWARGGLCAVLVFLVHGLSDFALQTPAIQALAATMLGCLAGLAAGRVAATSTPDPRPARAGAAIAAGVALCGLATAAPMMAAKLGGDLSAWPTAPADVLAWRIERGLADGAPSAQELSRIDGLSRRELALRPGSGSAWLRRAAVDAAAGREDAFVQALERSFAVAPLQSSLFRARTVFAFEHWDRITPAVRAQALYHLKAEWRHGTRRKFFVDLANGIRNPAGRVGMALQIAVLRLQR